MTTTDPVGVPLGAGWVAVGPVGSLHVLRLLRLVERDIAGRNGGGSQSSALFRLLAMFEVAAEYVYRNPSEHAEVPQRPSLSSSARPSSSLAVWASPIGTREAAELLGCTDRNVRALCSRGVFSSAARRRRSWVLDRDEVAARAG